MFLFYVLSFFKKGDTYSRGDIIQGGTLFKEIRYLRKMHKKKRFCSRANALFVDGSTKKGPWQAQLDERQTFDQRLFLKYSPTFSNRAKMRVTCYLISSIPLQASFAPFSSNPTIFNIIWWNDGSTERSFRHRMVQGLFW